ncbi:hypothetical protein LTR78_009826 [Recurvomyces mirabilis]|uniref:NAD(P)-binding domain-containing protein n=1 Tax=Recurvomyces mirabilis TaxID=574656 RepID=A0AAE0TR59_9PEZI|nr:hypothetical protein LTR78_009826 [Recurvomyces mirabilis]KAK5153062.1 hypothetical protein LTS14_007706 [Recurvomyces mirabilis]
MPTYALLGATGSTGSAVLRCLLSDPAQTTDKITLNIFIRSKSKLMRLFPDIQSTTRSNIHINIIESTPDDTPGLQKALRDAEIIFQCIAANDVTPKVSVAEDTVKAVLKAMRGLHEEQGEGYVTPAVLQLRAAPLNETFSHQSPWLIESMIKFALHYTYSDIQRGCDLFVSAKKMNPTLLGYIFVDTGAVHDADGTECTGHRLTIEGPLAPAISYADTGAGMCEIARRVEEFKGLGVGIVATGRVRLTWGTNAYYLAMGVKARIIG